MTKEKTFPLEKILTESAKSYVSSKDAGKALYEYDMVGVHVESGNTYPPLVEIFAKKVPEGTEVVVGYLPSVAVTSQPFTDTSRDKVIRIASGTALIPKKREESK